MPFVVAHKGEITTTITLAIKLTIKLTIKLKS